MRLKAVVMVCAMTANLWLCVFDFAERFIMLDSKNSGIFGNAGNAANVDSSSISAQVETFTLAPFEQRLQRALADLREGRPVLLMDDFDRENEADLIVAAEKINVESMA